MADELACLRVLDEAHAHEPVAWRAVRLDF
jgi:hypothetical protein